VVFEVTRKCGLSCGFCYNVWKAQKGPQPEELALADYGHLAKILPPAGIFALSGGEPLLRPDLMEIADLLRPKCKTLTLLTSGMDLTPALATGIAERDMWTQLPVHGLKQAHDQTCGRPGAFNKLVSAFATLKERGARYSTSTVASRLNLGNLRDILEFSVAMGSRYLLLIRFLPGGAGLNRKDLLLDPKQTENAYEMLDEVCGYYGLRGGVGVPNLPCMIDEKRFKHVDFGSCGAGKRWFVVGPSGELRLCNHSPAVYGNLMHQTLDEITAHPVLRDFGADRIYPGSCSGCEKVAACRGGCRAAAETLHGDLRGPDPLYVEGARLPGFGPERPSGHRNQ